MMTDDQIAVIAARLRAITPGEWIADGNTIRHIDGLFYWVLSEGKTGEVNHAKFIAHAPADIAALLDDRAALAGRVEALLAGSQTSARQIEAQQARIAELEAALRMTNQRIADIDPIEYSVPCSCWFCEETTYDDPDNDLKHADNCVWASARRALEGD